MTLEVVCDLFITGSESDVAFLKSRIKPEDLNPGSIVENFSSISSKPTFFHLFFTTRYEPPIAGIKQLSIKFPKCKFALTFDDNIGNDGRIFFFSGEEKPQEYKGDFRIELEELVEQHKLPKYGVLISSSDENEFRERVLRYAEGLGYTEKSENVYDICDWLQDAIGADFGAFEVENLSLIFRKWEKEEF